MHLLAIQWQLWTHNDSPGTHLDMWVVEVKNWVSLSIVSVSTYVASWANGTKKIVFYVEQSGEISWTPFGCDGEMGMPWIETALAQLERALGQDVAFPDGEKALMGFMRAMADSGNLVNKEDGTPIALGVDSKIAFDWSPPLPTNR